MPRKQHQKYRGWLRGEEAIIGADAESVATKMAEMWGGRTEDYLDNVTRDINAKKVVSCEHQDQPAFQPARARASLAAKEIDQEPAYTVQRHRSAQSVGANA